MNKRQSKLGVNLLKNFLIQDNIIIYGHTNILGLDYRVALLKLYFVVPGISIPKIRKIG